MTAGRRAGSGHESIPLAVSRFTYRVGQFLKGLRGPSAADDRLALEVLPASLQPLYLGMNGYGRRHAVDVCRALRSQGWSDAALLQAALLHDVGKGSQPLVLRSVVVLLEQLAPAISARLGDRPTGPWGFLYRDRMHAQVSADAVLLAGGEPEVARIIAGHYDPSPADPRIRALQAVDDYQ